MGDELDINIIKVTQNSLGKYVKRPPLSEKLLKKPPFRFLHDIITSVLKTTGFFNGLFEEEELNSENVKDRDSKIHFLNKVINVVGTTIGQPLQIKASKVIAGQEPEKTNELLQNIALALDKKLSSDEAVNQYKTSVDKQTSNVKKSTETKKPSKGSTDTKTNVKSNDKSIANSDHVKKIKPKDNVAKKEISTKKTTQNTKVGKKSSDKIQKENNNLKKLESLNKISSLTPKDNQNTISQDSISSTDIQNNSNLVENREETINISNTISETDIIVSHEAQADNQQSTEDSKINENNSELHLNLTNIETLPEIIEEKTEQKSESILEESKGASSKDLTSAKINHSVINNDSFETKHKDSSEIARPLSVRPSSSRPGAPRVRDKYEDILPESESLLMGKVCIIAESTVLEEDEESSIVVVDEIDKNTKPELDIPSSEHGHLVQQILDSQKEFSQVSGITEIDWQFGAKKAKDVLHQEIEQLRFNVQALSRVANPLGRLLDHIQEDVEVMRQEIQQWGKSYEMATKDLMKQRVANEEFFVPYHSKIKQLDADITERNEKIGDIKLIIHKNAQRIEKLLAKGSLQ